MSLLSQSRTAFATLCVWIVSGCSTYYGHVVDVDQQFVTQAFNDGRKEALLAELVARKTWNAEVKLLAERVSQEHSLANQELEDAARQASKAVPSELDAASQSEIAHFETIPDERIDREYLSLMIKDHKRSMDSLLRQTNLGTAPELRVCARRGIALLQEHLTQSLVLEGKLKK